MLRVLVAAAVAAVGARAASEDARAVFTDVYAKARWGESVERSGPGSSVLFTGPVRAFLDQFIRENHVRRMVDAPCGSFHWMRHVVERVEDPAFTYAGFDVVDDVVERLQQLNASRCTFARGDITADPLPRDADLIFSRDALQHLAPLQIVRALRTFRDAAPRFLAVGGYPRGENRPIDTGSCFLVNLMREPFNLWPEHVVSEWMGDADGKKHIFVYTRENLAAWDLADLEVRVRLFMDIRERSDPSP